MKLEEFEPLNLSDKLDVFIAQKPTLFNELHFDNESVYLFNLFDFYIEARVNQHSKKVTTILAFEQSDCRIRNYLEQINLKNLLS